MFFKFFAKFTWKHQCRSLVVIYKVVGWKIPQNSQENTCARVLLLTKLQAWKNSENSLKNTCARVLFLINLLAGGTISTSNYWCACIFRQFLYCTTYYHMHSVLLLVTGNSCNCLHSVNITSNLNIDLGTRLIWCREFWWWSAKKTQK